ncbi:MAG: hypothetical protein QOD72_3225 [Acidimicrobiaceae bacterium]|jgi:glycerol-3-phosphate acyltransferase PlsY|nr:hypothetical protein [Acidimicrobiaceae bacterium]
MSKTDGLVVVGFGVAACVACCAGPIFGFLAATGVATAFGVLVFGAVGLLPAVPAVVVLVRRRRARHRAPVAVPVSVTTPPARRRP